MSIDSRNVLFHVYRPLKTKVEQRICHIFDCVCLLTTYLQRLITDCYKPTAAPTSVPRVSVLYYPLDYHKKQQRAKPKKEH